MQYLRGAVLLLLRSPLPLSTETLPLTTSRRTPLPGALACRQKTRASSRVQSRDMKIFSGLRYKKAPRKTRHPTLSGVLLLLSHHSPLLSLPSGLGSTEVLVLEPVRCPLSGDVAVCQATLYRQRSRGDQKLFYTSSDSKYTSHEGR